MDPRAERQAKERERRMRKQAQIDRQTTDRQMAQQGQRQGSRRASDAQRQSERGTSALSIPSPPAGVPLVLVDRGEATSDAAAKLAEERKRRCVEETKRWHPHKWVGKPLAPRARNQIMAEVTNVFRRVDAEKQKAGL